ncbi:MAG: hypothetical protein HON53_06510 [Planctomycetaceae bacterium]|jgi:hypothetical protein|nr:hypothetical protein [Planctomycetaceae bacterium]MBT6153915.1 hypothetical protein [Planctomycetaceae bacterium]MBT6486614.1 hypothetical protein [Planctomycetaceae bacterium]MBT6498171.1 hypothetical protein [Planctomycetaceae bacterium]
MYTNRDFKIAAAGICPGPDLEWFALDRDGNVGGFTNAGFAAVPTNVFDSYELFCQTRNVIESLPLRGDAVWVTEKPPCFDTWDDWAKRGLFGFDWNHYAGQPDPSLPYVAMSRPTDPITVSDLPDDVAAYLKRVAFPNLSFDDTSDILVMR